MKKQPLQLTILFFLIILVFNPLKAQIIFSEDFDGIPGATNGGAGTYAFPSGWKLVNVDNRTPAGSVAYVNEAWERREDFSNNVSDSAAFSTSWYAPAGAADDWMWTPLIGPITANTKLTWNAVTYDVSFPDGYQVRVMTVAPTGSTGVIGNMVTNSTQIFSIAAENTSWTAREVSLAAYAGQSVYIGFRNNSNDQFLLLIDDIVVENVVQYGADLVALTPPSHYTQTPIKQAGDGMAFGANVKNIGVQTLTNVALNVKVKDALGNLVHDSTGVPLVSLAANATDTVFVDPFIPEDTGTYSVYYSIVSTEVNTAVLDSATVNYTDTIYARDNGDITGSLGIGAGNGGYLGQDFEITTVTELSSITMRVNSGNQDERLAAVIWDMSGGKPNTIIGGTDTLIYTDDSARTYTIKMHGGAVHLEPGKYTITAVEFESTLALAYTSAPFYNGTAWVYWPTSPFGDWANIEAFGPGFAKYYYLRANLGACVTAMASPMMDTILSGTSPQVVLTSMPEDANFSWTVNVTSGSVTGASAGSGDTIQQVLEGDGVVEYTVTPELDGCGGPPIVVTIAINPTILFSAHPADSSVCLGAPAGFFAEALNAQTYQWQVNTGSGFEDITDGLLYTGSTTTDLSINGTSSDMNGYQYHLLAMTLDETDTSLSAVLTVVTAVSPVVTPDGVQAICSGSTLELSATGAVSYSWYKDGDPLNETDPTLTVTDGGEYYVVGTDAMGCSANSSTVSLSLNALPEPNLYVDNTDFCKGDSMIIQTDEFVTYRWRRNGVLLPNAYNRSYVIRDAGYYSVDVIDIVGCKGTSSLAHITQNPLPPVNLNKPDTNYICDGHDITLSIPNTSEDYQWFKNGQTIADATNNSYKASTSGSYSVVAVSGLGCRDTSGIVAVIVMASPGVPTISHLSNTVLRSSEAQLYQWFRNGSPINGANARDYTLTEDGTYYVIVANTNGCYEMSAEVVISGLGISTSQLKTINVFPNPMVDFLTIESPNQGQYQLYDLNGRLVANGYLNTGKSQVNVVGLARGIYQLRLQTDLTNVQVKLVK